MRGKRIARVFVRRTKATPDDALAYVGCRSPDKMDLSVDEIHISVTFTWDIPVTEVFAEKLVQKGVPVYLGGPAYNAPGGDFVPGVYLKQGYVITSRGCNNRCWFCSVPKREGYQLRELPITEGWNVLDDNLLACTDAHINAVFDMLSAQDHKPIFTGGLEARLLKPWHAERLRAIRTERLYMAYDTPDNYDPLVEAGKVLRNVGFTFAGHRMGCYVLIGYPGDTFDKAERRLVDTIKAGFVPYAMLYRDAEGKRDAAWKQYQRTWVRREIVCTKMQAYRHLFEKRVVA